jgi:hypothetical protein
VSEQVRVELVRREVPADEATVQGRAALIERMQNLGQLDADADGQVSETVTGWVARINGAEFPVTTFSVEPPEDGGRALVSLLVPADSVQVGDPSTGATPPQLRPAVEEKPKVSTWGAAGTPDPRENIPGWKPETSQIHINYTPGDGDIIKAAVREHMRRGGAAGVPA